MCQTISLLGAVTSWSLVVVMRLQPEKTTPSKFCSKSGWWVDGHSLITGYKVPAEHKMSGVRIR